MRRILPLCAAVILLGSAIVLWRLNGAQATLPPPPAAELALPPAPAAAKGHVAGREPSRARQRVTASEAPRAPEASEASREARRFRRYDKDRDASVSREEYLAARRKAYAKLDRDGDGTLNFDEYAVKTIGKFDKADADDSDALSSPEFATTATKRAASAKRQETASKAPVNCEVADAGGGEDSGG